MVGVPASDTRAKDLLSISLIILLIFFSSLCSFKLISLFLISRWFNNLSVLLVSSHKIISTFERIFLALIVISCKLPMGVGTIYNSPIISLLLYVAGQHDKSF